jgi:hypothetical protein
MKIRATDGRSRDFDEAVIWVLQLWKRSLFNCNLEGLYMASSAIVHFNGDLLRSFNAAWRQ